jgi:pyruvate,water dikinase
VDGVGLTRIEFIVGEIGVHPMAIAHPERLDEQTRRAVEQRHRGYADSTSFFVDTLARGVATIAASQFPKPVIVRMSDFKTNEYARLLGGASFEPAEENPMIGFRGAARYYHDRYRDGFLLECRAMRYARERLGLTNIALMIPFCRTVDEADRVLAVMAEAGLRRGEKGLAIYMMCEVPSNVILAEQFAERFDGFSIGSNDLTQLTLGVDRDSEILAGLFDENNPAVLAAIREVITRAHRKNITVGLCGQGPSDDPAFAEALIEAGIDSISLNQDSVLSVRRRVAELEARHCSSR